MLPRGYLESRTTFNQFALQLQARCSSLSLTLPTGDNPKLTVDTAYLGPANAPNLVVIASGTHGVEAYAGAACQFHFMRTYANQRYHPDVGFLLVHAVNPWGYFHDRRVTHEGVDLNRNFISDFSRPPVATGYAEFHRRLVTNFRPLLTGIWNELGLLRCAISKKSRTAMQTAITAGQYQYAEGLFYGGSSPTQSRLAWEQIIRDHARARDCAFLLDVHTGLGKPGTSELISYLPESSGDFQEMCSWFGGELRSMQGGASVSAPVEGTLTAGFDRMLACRSYAVGLEFGTCAAVRVLNALRYDHWCHQQAATLSIKQRLRAREKMKRAFCLDTPDWHRQITTRFDQVINQVLAGLDREIAG